MRLKCKQQNSRWNTGTSKLTNLYWLEEQTTATITENKMNKTQIDRQRAEMEMETNTTPKIAKFRLKKSAH